jgi:hypothetical protein
VASVAPLSATRHSSAASSNRHHADTSDAPLEPLLTLRPALPLRLLPTSRLVYCPLLSNPPPLPPLPPSPLRPVPGPTSKPVES